VKLWTGFSWPRMEKAWGRRTCVNIAMNLLKWWEVFCVAERSLVFQVSFSPEVRFTVFRPTSSRIHRSATIRASLPGVCVP
jgi:hypothetical protein